MPSETYSTGTTPFWTDPLRVIEQKILTKLNTGVGGGGVTCGAADPVAAPTGTCGLYFKTSNGTLWAWTGAAWLELIGP
jgi:hypothetical protein